MTALGEVVIGTVELLEAEAKKFQIGLRSTLISVVLVAVAAMLMLGGLGWLIAAGFLQLRDMWGAVPAAATVGTASVLVSGGLLWYATQK